MNPKIIIIVHGGCVQAVLGTQPFDCHVIDYDCQAGDESTRDVPNFDNGTEPGNVFTMEVEVNTKWGKKLFPFVSHE